MSPRLCGPCLLIACNQILHDQRIAPDATLDPETLRRVAEFTGR